MRSGLYRGAVKSDLRPTGKLLIIVPAATAASVISANCAKVLVGYDEATEQVTWCRYGLAPGTPVWVMFEQGDTAHPVVIGLI